MMTPVSKFFKRVKQERKIRQLTLFYGAAFLSISIVMLGLYIIYWPKSDSKAQAASVPKSYQIANGARGIDKKEVWVSKLEKQIKGINDRYDQIEGLYKGLAGEKMANSQAQMQSGQMETPVNAPAHLNNQMGTDNVGDVRQQLQDQLKEKADGIVKGHPVPSTTPVTSTNNTVVPANIIPGNTTSVKPEIRKITFQLPQENSRKIHKTVDFWVPAGSFCQGQLTSGVVASTAIGASSNPRPVHIQLTDFANLPRRFRSDIKEAFLIGTAYGDLASERVYIRLEQLSLIERKTGEIIEVTVDGYAVGEDGANGIRGIMVDRAGPALRNAFIGGFVGGMGNFFGAQQTQPMSFVGSGVGSINPMTAKQLLESAGSKALGNSMEKLSDFYIKRAEQLQPTLELEPGRKITITFTKGFDMSQTVFRRAVMERNDADRRQIANHHVNHTGNPASQNLGDLNINNQGTFNGY